MLVDGFHILFQFFWFMLDAQGAESDPYMAMGLSWNVFQHGSATSAVPAVGLYNLSLRI